MDYNDKKILDDYLIKLKKYKLLSKEEEDYLLEKIKEGDSKAREKFIYSNLRLVINIAKKYRNRGLSFMELIQEGNIGLIESIDKFDITKGYRFSTYAVWWIKHYVSRAVINKVEIKMPNNIYEKLALYNKAYNMLFSKLERVPTDEEIKKELKCSDEEYITIRKFLEKPVSLNSQMKDNSQDEIIDFVASSDNTPEDAVINSSLMKDLEKLINTSNLQEREKEVLYDTVIYGKTCGDLVDKYNLTRQRILQIRDAALSKIRRNTMVEDYLIYADDLKKGLSLIKKSKCREI